MSDLISRQAAIDAIEPTIKSILQGNSFKAINVMDKIRELPSAQPEVTAKDVEEYCIKRCLTVITNDLFLKLMAERRTDDSISD